VQQLDHFKDNECECNFLWLFTTLNFLSGAGYSLFSGVGGIGDWADVARGAMPLFVWRLLSSRSPIGAMVAFARRQRRALDENKQTAHRPGIYRSVLNNVNPATPIGNLSSPFFGKSVTLNTFGPLPGAGPNAGAGNRHIELQLRLTFR
jgi:hypothetical protein